MGVLSDAYGVTSSAPFFQVNSDTTINGVTVHAGTYIKAAFIADATISNAMIKDAAINNAKIADLNAAKITAGILSADRIDAGAITGDKIAANTITAGKIDSRSLSIKDADGNVIFSASNNLALSRVSGVGAFASLDKISASNISTYISGAAIGFAYIADDIQSSDYNATNQTGWRIAKGGQMEMNNATFRGSLNVSSSSTSGSTQIKNNVIKVFDSAGTLRVKIGDLSA
jgi:hypothetical protein